MNVQDNTLKKMLISSGDDYHLKFDNLETKNFLRHVYTSAESAVQEGRDPVAAIRYAWIGPKGNMSDKAWENHYQQASRILSASGLIKGNPMLKVTLRRGNKTKTVCINPKVSHLKKAGYKRSMHVGGGRGGVRPYIEYYRGGRAMKGEPSTVYRKRYFNTVAERDAALFETNPRRRRNPDSAEAVELKLFIDNDGTLYKRQTVPIQQNLSLKFTKGRYDHSKAPKLWMYLVDNGAKEYARQFDHPNRWNLLFPISVRREVAKAMADDWYEEMKAGNFNLPVSRGGDKFFVVNEDGSLAGSRSTLKAAKKLKAERKATDILMNNPRRPAKTKLVYVVQGQYPQWGSSTWEDENEEDNWTDAKRSIKEYRENGPGNYRLIKRRVPIESNPRGAKRITKKQWYAMGGLQTVGLFRKQRRDGGWQYFKSN